MPRHRFGHYLRPARAQECPATVVILDALGRRSPLAGGHLKYQTTLGLATARSYHVAPSGLDPFAELATDSPEKLWDFVWRHSDRRQTTWVLGFDLGKVLTYLDLWGRIEEGWMGLSQYCLCDPPIWLYLRRNSRTMCVCDLRNYYDVSWSDLASGTGSPLPPEPEETEPDCQWRNYASLRLDAAAHAADGLFRCCHTHLAGCLRPTIAGVAFAGWSTHFLGHHILVHAQPEVTALERAALYGGTCECHYLGNVREPVSIYDCNGLYPSVMQTERFPRRLVHHTNQATTSQLWHWLNEGAAIARVHLSHADHAYPWRSTKGCLSCTGSFDATLPGPELRQAILEDALDHIYEVAIYEADPIFAAFVSHFERFKREAEARGDRAGRMFFKQLLNALQGKFAQQTARWVGAPDVPIEQPWGNWWTTHPTTGKQTWIRAIAGTVQRMDSPSDWYHAIPGVTAYVTGYGRCRISELLLIGGRRSVFYTDTDAVHVSDRGAERIRGSGLVSATALGAYKLLHRGVPAQYRGWKNYTLGSKLVIAGLHADHEQLDEGVYRVREEQSLTQILSSRPDGTVLTREKILEFRKLYDRGAVSRSGWVTPYRLEE